MEDGQNIAFSGLRKIFVKSKSNPFDFNNCIILATDISFFRSTCAISLKCGIFGSKILNLGILELLDKGTNNLGLPDRYYFCGIQYGNRLKFNF